MGGERHGRTQALHALMPLPATVPNGARSAIRIPPSAVKRCSPGSPVHSFIDRTHSIDRSLSTFVLMILLTRIFFLLLCALLLLLSYLPRTHPYHVFRAWPPPRSIRSIMYSQAYCQYSASLERLA